MTRIANITGIERCKWCNQDGLVATGTRPEGHGHLEMLGPCPHCEVGFRIEFPTKSRPVWGQDGYWQGRTPDIAPAPKDGYELHKTENHMRHMLLLRRYSGQPTANPCIGIEINDRKMRYSILSEALKQSPAAAAEPLPRHPAPEGRGMDAVRELDSEAA